MSERQSRRAVLAGLAGGAAALAARAVGRTPAARAVDGDPLILGQTNVATQQTIVNGEFVVENPHPLGLAMRARSSGGIFAEGTNGAAVGAFNRHKFAVFADTEDGRALYGQATGGGIALEVHGRAVFFGRSGKLVIPARTSSASQTNVQLTSESLVLATIQQQQGDKGLWVGGVSLESDSFTVHLNKRARADTQVGWLIVN